MKAAGVRREIEGAHRERSMDWDKLRIFHAAADAGSFTHAGDALGLSQSAVSRQVSALEADLKVPLFHRHARGLILTEQGELLYRTVHDVFMELRHVRTRLTDSREKPSGTLRVTTTLGLGTNWLTPRLREFVELYPDIQLQLILDDDEIDISMREADVAIRLRQPTQPDLIQRRLFTVHFHIYASPDIREAARHPPLDGRSGRAPDHYLRGPGAGLSQGHQLAGNRGAGAGQSAGADHADQYDPRHQAAVQHGLGLAVLPDYLIEENSNIIVVLPDEEIPHLESYLVFPEEIKDTARLGVFKDFVIAKARGWKF
jgi:DNA-binding transcriptional LysR family regulator